MVKTLFTEAERRDLRETIMSSAAPDDQLKRGKTADGQVVILWGSGAVTGPLGYQLRGVPIARPKTQAKRNQAIMAGFALLADVALYDASELGDAYKAYRWQIEKHKSPGDARARFHNLRSGVKRGKVSGLKPHWEVLRADARGKPTERYWRLPRIRWPRLAVFDHMGKWRGGRERYELVNVDPHGTTTPTGLTFKNLRELEKHLQSL